MPAAVGGSASDALGAVGADAGRNPAAGGSSSSVSGEACPHAVLASISRSSALAITGAAAVAAAFPLPLDAAADVLLAIAVNCKLLFAGAMSAVVSRTAMAPLERLKMDAGEPAGGGGAGRPAGRARARMRC
jgi:hypothetical protein